MRATAQVQPLALTVDGDRLARRQVAYQLRLVALAPRLEECDGRFAVPFLAHERRAGGDDLAHLRLDGREILGAERLVACEIVIEAILDRRADRHLRAGMQRLHRLRQHMRRIVPDHAERVRIAAGDEHHPRIALDPPREIHGLPIDLHGQRGTRQPRSYGGRDLGSRRRGLEAANGAVWQRDGGHDLSPALQRRTKGQPVRRQPCGRSARGGRPGAAR